MDQIGDRANAAHVALHGLAPQVGSLEDLFMQWTGDAEHHPVSSAADEKEKEVVLR